jgi:predicted esterase
MKPLLVLSLLGLPLWPLCVNLGMPPGALDKTKLVDWSRPETIDPLDEHVGDFLDIDLHRFEREATEALRQKNYKDAARNYLLILRHSFDDAATIYRLASCYGLMGEPGLAARYLVRAANAGFTDLERLKRDRNFRRVRGNPAFDNVERAIEEWGRNLGSMVYFKSSKMTKCRILLPERMDREQQVPLLIALHGNGGNAESMAQIWKSFRDPKFILAAPEGAYQVRYASGGRQEQYSWEIRVHDEELWKAADPLIEETILEITRRISSLHKISEVYLLGFSQGAAYAYIMGIKHPEVFRGILCIGGALPPRDKPYSLLTDRDISLGKGLRVFIAHGKADPLAAFERALQAKELLQARGYDVTWSEFDGGHEIPASVLGKAAEWIKAR